MTTRRSNFRFRVWFEPLNLFEPGQERLHLFVHVLVQGDRPGFGPGDAEVVSISKTLDGIFSRDRDVSRFELAERVPHLPGYVVQIFYFAIEDRLKLIELRFRQRALHDRGLHVVWVIGEDALEMVLGIAINEDTFLFVSRCCAPIRYQSKQQRLLSE